MADAGASLASSVVQPAVSFGIKYINRKVEYGKSLEDNYRVLKEDLETLRNLKEDHERRVQEQNDKVASKDYLFWKHRTSNVVIQVHELDEKYERKRLSKWFYFKRPAFSEKMKTKDNEVKSLIEEGRSINIFTVDKPPEPVIKVFPDLKIIGYPTLEKALKDILNCLNNSNVKVIGVHGQKGVGKTTILKHLNDCDEVSRQFDVVIFIRGLSDQNVTQNLQKAIANRLNVKIKASEGSMDEDAQEIRKKLQDKKYLLILDGIVNTISLHEVGIPDNDKGSNVVIASQFLHVCNRNNSDMLVEVNLLEELEAWHMFKNSVGFANLMGSPQVQSIAKLVCRRCSYLPLLLHKTARSLESTTETEILEELEDLNNQWIDFENEGIEELYSFLKGCYKKLQDQQQICFLYTSLYPADTKIYTNYLVECWVAQGFLGKVNRRGSYQTARITGRGILRRLTKFSLLDKGERMMHVTLVGCMREFAQYILSTHSEYDSYLARVNEERKGAKWVSLINTELHKLPIKDHNKLEALLLWKTKLSMPHSFFDNMSNLLLLDLYSTSIRQLPSSLSKLTSLKGLYLNACEELEELPPQVKSLQLLEVLDIQGTNVAFISSCIESLVNLRCLRIPYIKSGNARACHGDGTEADNSGAISKLKYLEELTIEVKSCEEWNNGAKTVMKHVFSLEGLITLNCSFPSSDVLDSFRTSMEQWRDQVTPFQYSQENDQTMVFSILSSLGSNR